MRNFNPQNNQENINERILSEYYIKENINFDENDTFGTNTWLPNFLNYFTHSDTYFTCTNVRIQGWLLLPEDIDINIHLPSYEIECVTKNGMFISNIIL